MCIISSSCDWKKYTLYWSLYTLHPCVSVFPSNVSRGWILMQCILYMYMCGTWCIALDQFSLLKMNYGINAIFNFNRCLNHVYFSQTSSEVKCFCSASLYINLWPKRPSLTGLETLLSGLVSLKFAWHNEPMSNKFDSLLSDLVWESNLFLKFWLP